MRMFTKVSLGRLLQEEQKLELEFQGEILIHYEIRKEVEFHAEEILWEDIKRRQKEIGSFQYFHFLRLSCCTGKRTRRDRLCKVSRSQILEDPGC